MICPKCGRRTYKNETVCPKCGADMAPRRILAVTTARVQVKNPEYTTPAATAVYSEPVYTPDADVYQPPAPKPVPEPVKVSPPEPVPKPAEKPAEVPSAEKEDLDRTLTFAAIKDSSSIETAAVREYNRMKAQLRESRAFDDGSKVVLERLPEGYVYVKMSIDDADKLNRRKSIPKPLVIAVAGAAVITVFLIILLVIVTGGSSKPLIVGKWQGEIEPLRFGISGIPFTTVDTVWNFTEDGDVSITPQESLLSGYKLSGTYKLSQSGSDSIVKLELDFNGEKILLELIYTVNKGDGIMQISNREFPAYTYTLEKLN